MVSKTAAVHHNGNNPSHTAAQPKTHDKITASVKTHDKITASVKTHDKITPSVPRVQLNYTFGRRSFYLKDLHAVHVRSTATCGSGIIMMTFPRFPMKSRRWSQEWPKKHIPTEEKPSGKERLHRSTNQCEKGMVPLRVAVYHPVSSVKTTKHHETGRGYTRKRKNKRTRVGKREKKKTKTTRLREEKNKKQKQGKNKTKKEQEKEDNQKKKKRNQD